MTVIAWDGTTLAADKRATFQGLQRTTTKIFKVGDKLVAACGNAAQCAEMVEWVRCDCPADRLPPLQRDKDDWISLLVVSRDGVDLYERSPYPVRLEDKFTAMGSGRDYALAAMYLGKTAKEAVELASIFEVGCGNGVDVLRLGPSLSSADYVPLTQHFRFDKTTY